MTQTHLTVRPIEEIYATILQLSPQVVSRFHPSNMAEQRVLFLRGDIKEPDHVYEILNNLDIEHALQKLKQLRQELKTVTIKAVYKQVYLDAIDLMINKYQMMSYARTFKLSLDAGERNNSKDQFMRLNELIYGKPEHSTFLDFANRMHQEIASKQLPAQAKTIRDEFLRLLPDTGSETNEVFHPRPQAVRAMQAYAMKLYGPLLRHIPKQDMFTSQEIAAVFETILRKEFSKAAKTWRVVIEDATSIKVVVVEKKIVIPCDRLPITLKKLRELVAHEIGVHFLRAIAGAATDLQLLELGLSGSYTFEEGAGKVAEQLVSGECKDIISPVYFVAGLANEGGSFRDAYEVLWRHEFLKKVEKGDQSERLDRLMAEAQNLAYMTVLRIFRGTDSLPWFKDLAYYKGTQAAWRFFESCVDKNGKVDKDRISYAFLGKIDPQNSLHRSVMEEVLNSKKV